MKKIILFTFFTALCFSFSSCYKRCKNVQHIERAYLMTKYFGNYIPGAWWVYLNRDSTKRDSIWVDNFKTTTVTDEDNCLSADEVSFDMHNQYLEPTQKLRVTIGFNGNDLITNVYESYDANGNGYTRLQVRNDSSSFYSGNIVFSILNNYPLWYGNPDYILPEVVKAGTLVFAPDFGLVQYVPLTTTDTFSLIKFHLP